MSDRRLPYREIASIAMLLHGVQLTKDIDDEPWIREGRAIIESIHTFAPRNEQARILVTESNLLLAPSALTEQEFLYAGIGSRTQMDGSVTSVSWLAFAGCLEVVKTSQFATLFP